MYGKEILIENAAIVNEGECFRGSILIRDGIIAEITHSGRRPEISSDCIIRDAEGMLAIPGVIDDQVHFREPGNTYKGDIASESVAAVSGGVTTFMDMPNNNPPTCSEELLEKKYDRAGEVSPANYAFYMGASNSNIAELLEADPSKFCGIKVFMGSSTGNMLVDDPQVLEKIFASSPKVVATHCEEESIVRANMQKAIEKYGDEIPFSMHPEIRSRKACICSTSKALSLAMKYGTALHVLHLSTEDELEMIRIAQRTNPEISGEICVHYLFFNDSMYDRFGAKMKCNPAIKRRSDMIALRKAVRDGIIKVIATDHAPHLPAEKSGIYTKAASGLPLVQHSLPMMLELAYRGVFSGNDADLEYDFAPEIANGGKFPEVPFEKLGTEEKESFTNDRRFIEGVKIVVDRMCHAPAERFSIKDRGYLRKGYHADIVLLRPSCEKIAPVYHCGWAPLSDFVFHSAVDTVLVNGKTVVKGGKLQDGCRNAGMRIEYRKR